MKKLTLFLLLTLTLSAAAAAETKPINDELAHGCHDQILGFEQPDILTAYRQADDVGSYTNVLLYTGQCLKHHAVTDHREYFAEGTEAYLCRNDFYPFVRAELKEHEPALHEELVKIWEQAN